MKRSHSWLLAIAFAILFAVDVYASASAAAPSARVAALSVKYREALAASFAYEQLPPCGSGACSTPQMRERVARHRAIAENAMRLAVDATTFDDYNAAAREATIAAADKTTAALAAFVATLPHKPATVPKK